MRPSKYAPMTDHHLDRCFDAPQPTPTQQLRIDILRKAAREFADAIKAGTASSADQSAAIRQVREAMYTAISAITIHG